MPGRADQESALVVRFNEIIQPHHTFATGFGLASGRGQIRGGGPAPSVPGAEVAPLRSSRSVRRAPTASEGWSHEVEVDRHRVCPGWGRPPGELRRAGWGADSPLEGGR